MNKRYQAIIASLAYLLLVWGLGPYLAIAGKAPFASMTVRLIATAALALVWLIYFGIKQLRKLQFNRVKPAFLSDEEMLTWTAELQQRLKRVKHYLKKNPIGPVYQRIHRPWIYLLGEKNTGKTTLLANSPYTLLSTSDHKLSKIYPTRLVDWWIGDEAVFIDVAGKFSLPETADSKEAELWRQLLRLSKRHHGKNAINHLVICLDFPTLAKLDDQSLEQLQLRLAHQLHSLKAVNTNAQISVIVTQCDRMLGFNEFFSELGSDEREQCVGLQLDAGENISEQIKTQTKKLIGFLSERLLWRLHHEQSLDKRIYIKDYPMQMESLCQKLDTLLSNLPWEDNLSLEGIYFTSSLQQGSAVNIFSESLSKSLHASEKMPVASTSQHKPFFIAGLFKHIQQRAQRFQIRFQKIQWRRWIAYPLAAGIILFSTLLWHQAFQSNLEAIQIVRSGLSKPTPTELNAANLPWLVQLNMLQETINDLKQHQSKFFFWTGFNQAAKLRASTEKSYQRLLVNNFQSYLLGELTYQIQTGLKGNLFKLYDALKTYLILTTAKRFDKDAIKQWFVFHWRMQYPGNTVLQNTLQTHLDALLAIPNLTWQQNTSLITSAQKKLQSLSYADLAFLELQDQYSNKTTSLLPSNKAIQYVDLKHATIPVFYSPDNFDKIYNQKIPALADQIIQRSWVLGSSKPIKLDASQRDQIVAQVRNLYVNNYAKQWLAILPNIQLVKPKNLDQAQAMITLLNDPKSDFIQLLKIITGNIRLNITDKTSLKNNPSFTAISDFITQSNAKNAVHSTLQALSNYINQIAAAKNANQASYQAASNRFKQKNADDAISQLIGLAKTQPDPVKNWLYSIANGTWSVLLQNTQQFLNQQWSSKVYPFYHSNIDNSYPIFASSNHDISLNAFNQFFSPNGLIGNYFNAYLEPFVNTSQAFWTWKSLNGQQLNIPQSVLNMFIRASMIQQMFYSDNSKQIGFSFALSGSKLSDGVNSVSLTIGKQQFVAYRDVVSNKTFQWSAKDSTTAQLSFKTSTNDSPALSTKGTWAWFHLVDQGVLQPTENPQVYELAFHTDDYSITYNMVMNNRVNPFLPNVITAFRCPKTL